MDASSTWVLADYNVFEKYIIIKERQGFKIVVQWQIGRLYIYIYIGANKWAK